jgi:hypothetical protein
MRYDGYQTRTFLGLSGIEFFRLKQSPAFPKATLSTRTTETWPAEAIEAFAERMKHGAANGWKTPEALYFWDFDAPCGYVKKRRFAKSVERN